MIAAGPESFAVRNAEPKTDRRNDQLICDRRLFAQHSDTHARRVQQRLLVEHDAGRGHFLGFGARRSRSLTPTNLSSFASIYGSNGLTLSFGPGVAERDVYYTLDQTVGFPVLSAVHQSGLIRPATQYAVITPNKTTHLTLQHPYSFATPLSVRNEGVIQLFARDQFENIADGGRTLGENNGLVYSGIVQLTQSGSTGTVTLSGDGVGISTLTLTATATGIFTVRDIIQENLSLWATDYANPSINGRTGLPPSDGAVVTTGLVGTPTDIAPEPSGPQRAQDPRLIRISPVRFRKVTVKPPTHPDPVTMLRIKVEVKPPGVNTYSAWQALRVTKLGTIPDGDVIQVALWRDMGSKDGLLELGTDGDGTNIGIPVATGHVPKRVRQRHLRPELRGVVANHHDDVPAIFHHRAREYERERGTDARRGSHGFQRVHDSRRAIDGAHRRKQFPDGDVPVADHQNAGARHDAGDGHRRVLQQRQQNATVPQGEPGGRLSEDRASGRATSPACSTKFI